MLLNGSVMQITAAGGIGLRLKEHHPIARDRRTGMRIPAAVLVHSGSRWFAPENKKAEI